MACYPIVLLIVGLRQYDITSALSGTINNLIESCKNVDNSVVFPNYHHDMLTENHDIKFDKTHFFVVKDDLKRYINEITHNNSEGKMPKTRLNDDIKLDTPIPLSWSRAKLKKELEKNNINDITKTNTNPADKRQYLRKQKKVITIPAIDDMRTLIKNLKRKSPLVAISNKLLKKIMNIKDSHIKRNPFFANLSPGTPLSGKKKLFLGVPTNYLAKLILNNFQNSDEDGASQPFFKILIDAAMDFMGLGGKKKKVTPQNEENVDGIGDLFSNLFG